MVHCFPVLHFSYGLLIVVVGEINSIEAIRLFEGDLVLTPMQREAAEQGRDVNLPGIGRGVSKSYLWPGGIVPFSIEQQLKDDPLALEEIENGMKQWSGKTCIKFTERTNEKAFIYFFIGGSCFSEVGRTGDKQYISIAPHCWNAGDVAHEIAHALGFYHEQSRPDRDEYVTINWDNIVESEKVNFAKYGPSRINSFGVPYDYNSLMHFEEKAFSKNGQPTITPKQAGVSIGQRDSPSVLDIKQMNLLYKCNGGGDGNGGGGGGGESCKDFNYRCRYWASIGECNRNPGYMRVYCKKSCRVCNAQGGCMDRNRYCRQWAATGYCYSNPGYMRSNCKRSCGNCYG